MGKKASSYSTKKPGLSLGSVVYVGDKAYSELYIDVFEYNKDFIDEKELKNIEDALFYLQSRGIPKKEARALLMYAFANNVLESVCIPELKSRIKRIFAEKLGVSLGFDL